MEGIAYRAVDWAPPQAPFGRRCWPRLAPAYVLLIVGVALSRGRLGAAAGPPVWAPQLAPNGPRIVLLIA